MKSNRLILNATMALAIVFAAPLWAEGREMAEGAGRELRKVEVKDIVLDPRTRQPIVVLEEVEGDRLLPIWIGNLEAQAIAMELSDLTPPRPLTHDLTSKIIKGLKAEIQRVVITELKGGVYYAYIFMKSPERSFSLDSRPSDAIALALRLHAPIYVEPEVLKAGILKPPRDRSDFRKRLGIVLQRMTPGLAKYFGGGKAEGLLVSQVEGNSPASSAGLRRGDVIYAVGGKSVTSVRSFEREYKKHSTDMLLSIRRGPEGEALVIRMLLPSAAYTRKP